MGAETPDFSGWATKNDLLCSDGKTIRAGAFAHQDKMTVPLVWQHRHSDSENIIGRVTLENRDGEGVYSYAYLNNSKRAQEVKELIRHGDVNSMSIWANQLHLQGGDVKRGMIREVSVVTSGANPGALIDKIYIQHGDGEYEEADGEAIIYTGLELEHSDNLEGEVMPTEELVHEDEGPTVQEVYDSLNEDQQRLFDVFVDRAIKETKAEMAVSHSAFDEEEFLAHVDNKIQEGITEMTNVFEQSKTAIEPKDDRVVLSHSQFDTIKKDAERLGSLKESILSHADEYGITDIDMLFPDAKTLTSTPDYIKRRTEWVSVVLGGTRHTPFSRIKTVQADITADDARAKGYVKGSLKKDEIIKLLKRTTTPTTIYKKQKLDRDDVLDITSFDVVAWLKGEMRLMLEEELARAILIGDGREADDPDKIDEEKIRPIAWDDDMYTTRVNLQSGLTSNAYVEAIIRSRKHYKGTGNPTLFTTEDILVDMLLAKDKMGRELYTDQTALAAKLRVKAIVPVEVMESVDELIAVLVNLDDYTVGADNGGAVSMFDDFDIDYNQQKYLIETRVSGALTKPKSAVVLTQTIGTVVTPVSPTIEDNVITIPAITGVDYYIDDAVVTGTVTITETTDVEARPASGYSFPHGSTRDWTFAYEG